MNVCPVGSAHLHFLEWIKNFLSPATTINMEDRMGPRSFYIPPGAINEPSNGSGWQCIQDYVAQSFSAWLPSNMDADSPENDPNFNTTFGDRHVHANNAHTWTHTTVS